MKKKSRHLLSIKTRLLSVNVGIVLLSFIGIILVFNLLMNRFIANTATQQVTAIARQETQQATTPSRVPDLDDAPIGRLNTRSVTFHIDSHYRIITPTNAAMPDTENARKIASVLKAEQISLKDLKNYRLHANGSVFYIQTVEESAGNFLLYYTDMTGIVNFANDVNLYLVLIMLGVMLITSLGLWLSTGRLTRPLARLADSAKRIGKGDFEQVEIDFRDQEVATLADNLNQAAQELAANDKDQKIFFQNASHELRTPLMTIKSYAEGIQYDVMEAKTASATILSETDRMTELVEDLLTISRFDSLRAADERQTVDLCALIRDVGEEQAALASQRNLALVYQLPKTPVWMQANEKTLRRALSNLLSNALRYAKTQVVLSCRMAESERQIIVSNDGDEIARETLPHLFERFYKGQGGNHGIGLAIVKTVVESLGGEVHAESTAHETRFIMSFPC